MSARARSDSAHVASELRMVIGQLVRRLRAEHRFSLSQGSVLGRLDREGEQTVSDLATKERVRPQSMAQTVADLEGEGYVTRSPDPRDGRRALVALTATGRATLEQDRRRREGWLAEALEERLTREERQVVERAVGILRRLAEGE